MAFVEIRQITKRFGRLTVLDRCELTIAKGQVVSLLGASGSGKTTLLNTIAGFVEPGAGEILLDGAAMTELPPNRRNVGMVFQSYALFPHLTVARNVGYGLTARGRSRAEIRSRVAELLALVGLEAMAERYPHQLSGGQQQRVALARVLILAPRLLLLDEPFSALDAKLRAAMQIELVTLIRRLELTAIFVTHDQDEALTISDRVAIMRDGIIEQVDRPTVLYDQPRTAFVADFVGTSNLLPARVAEGAVCLPDGQLCRTDLDGDVIVLIRPENISIEPTQGQGGVAGTVIFAKHVGPTSEYEVTLDGAPRLRALVMRASGSEAYGLGEPVRLRVVDPSACRIFPQ